MVPIGVLYKHFSGKHEFRENRLGENHILLTGVNDFLPVPVLATFFDIRKCAKFNMGDHHAVPLIFLFIVWFERNSVEEITYNAVKSFWFMKVCEVEVMHYLKAQMTFYSVFNNFHLIWGKHLVQKRP